MLVPIRFLEFNGIIMLSQTHLVATAEENKEDVLPSPVIIDYATSPSRVPCSDIHEAARLGDIEAINEILSGDNHDPEAVTTLLEYKESLTEKIASDTSTPRESHFLEVIDTLLPYKSNVINKKIDGAIGGYGARRNITPLHLAAENHHHKAIDALSKYKENIRHDAVMEVDSFTNVTAIWLSIYQKKQGKTRDTIKDTIDALVNIGENVNIAAIWYDSVNHQSYSGITPLHRAVIQGELETVKILLSHGAQIRADSTGRTPMDYAILNHYPEMAICFAKHLEKNNNVIPETTKLALNDKLNRIVDEVTESKNISDQNWEDAKAWLIAGADTPAIERTGYVRKLFIEGLRQAIRGEPSLEKPQKSCMIM